MYQNRLLTASGVYRLPRPQEPTPSPRGFILVPFISWQPAQRGIYQIAWENAQAMLRPSLPERDLLGVWN
jgi:hypothetical protein